jgi:hypothetical protein
VAALAARMSAVHPDPFETLRAELVEALARMVNRVIESGKGEVQRALYHLAVIRDTLAAVPNVDDFLDDLDAAERALRAHLLA